MGFNKAANPDVAGTLQAAVDKINGLAVRPEFLLHTGDISHLSKPEEFDAVEQILKRSEEHTSELQSRLHLVCRLLLEKRNWRNVDPWASRRVAEGAARLSGSTDRRSADAEGADEFR